MSDSQPALGPAARLSRRVTLKEAAREPFRIFFPLGLLAGLLGVSLWPLHFNGIVSFYPGASHARLMAHGFFGAFILGFLGTALPRLLSAKPFRVGEILALLGLHAAMVCAYVWGRISAGDVLLLVLLTVFTALMGIRIRQRQDMPPPGFVLIALAFACVAGGAILSLQLNPDEPAVFQVNLQHLLSYQGFVLLPILGAGAYIIPRFFDLPNQQDFPESRTPPPGWMSKALIAGTAGGLVVASFFIEAAGWYRTGDGIRLVTAAAYLLREIPLHRAPGPSNALAIWLKTAFVLLLAGFLAVLLLPDRRIALLHLTLVGGFAIVTMSVATRVVFGHSGNRALLAGRNRWLHVATGLMLFAMLTRISGDFFPKIMASHYNYGAVLWISGALVWAAYVLPKVLIPDQDE